MRCARVRESFTSEMGQTSAASGDVDTDCRVWRTHKVTRQNATRRGWGHFSPGAGSVAWLLMGAVQQETEKVRGDDEDDETREGSSPGSDRVLRRGRRGRDLSRFLLPILSVLPSHTHKHTLTRTHIPPSTFANYQICWLGSCSPKTVSHRRWAVNGPIYPRLSVLKVSVGVRNNRGAHKFLPKIGRWALIRWRQFSTGVSFDCAFCRSENMFFFLFPVLSSNNNR